MRSKEEIIYDFIEDLFNELKLELKDFKDNDELISIMDIALFLKNDSDPRNEYKDQLRKEILKYLPLNHKEENIKFKMKYIIGLVSSIFILFGLTFPFRALTYLNKPKISDTVVYQGYRFDNLKNRPLLYNDYGDVFYFHFPNFFLFR